jgi:endonuclease G
MRTVKGTYPLSLACSILATLHGAAQDFFIGGMPKTNGHVANLRITVITNVAYVVGYDETRKDPAWVAYKLVKKSPPFHLPRPSGYPTDENTISKVPANAYADSPPDPLAGNARWDHGHMAANDAVAKIFGSEAQLATFKMSNMCPQSHRLNAGKWKSLEQREYGYSQRFGELWTICGPIFTRHIRTLTYGIEVPDGYYKILVRKSGNDLKALAITFDYFPSASDTTMQYFQNHLASIRDIENLTGLDFFNQLPKPAQDTLEMPKAVVLW